MSNKSHSVNCGFFFESHVVRPHDLDPDPFVVTILPLISIINIYIYIYILSRHAQPIDHEREINFHVQNIRIIECKQTVPLETRAPGSHVLTRTLCIYLHFILSPLAYTSQLSSKCLLRRQQLRWFPLLYYSLSN